MQDLQRALQSSPGLPFLTGPPTSAKQIRGHPSAPACFATITTELGSHHSGTQQVTSKGWGRREGAPPAHHGTLAVRRQAPARLCTPLEMRPSVLKTKQPLVSQLAPHARKLAAAGTAPARLERFNQPRCSDTHSPLHISASAPGPGYFPVLRGPLHTRLASYAAPGTTLGSLIGS